MRWIQLLVGFGLVLCALITESTAPCQHPESADIVWLLESSSSIMQGDELVGIFKNMTSFVNTLAVKLLQPSLNNRMGFVTFAGIYKPQPEWFQNIYDELPLTQNAMDFTKALAPLKARGGATDAAFAVDYVSSHFFSSPSPPQTTTAVRKRILILMMDGHPTDNLGVPSEEAIRMVNAAAKRIRHEKKVVFVFLRMGSGFEHQELLSKHVDAVFDASFSQMEYDLEGFLCELPSAAEIEHHVDTAAFSVMAQPATEDSNYLYFLLLLILVAIGGVWKFKSRRTPTNNLKL